jgi:hypothetical protein
LVGLGRIDQLEAGDLVRTWVLLILIYGLLPLVDKVEPRRTISKCAASAALIRQPVYLRMRSHRSRLLSPITKKGVMKINKSRDLARS